MRHCIHMHVFRYFRLCLSRCADDCSVKFLFPCLLQPDSWRLLKMKAMAQTLRTTSEVSQPKLWQNSLRFVSDNSSSSSMSSSGSLVSDLILRGVASEVMNSCLAPSNRGHRRTKKGNCPHEQRPDNDEVAGLAKSLSSQLASIKRATREIATKFAQWNLQQLCLWCAIALKLFPPASNDYILLTFQTTLRFCMCPVLPCSWTTCGVFHKSMFLPRE